MKSNVYKIARGELELGSILEETEKVARYNGLTGKSALSLRLLAEELVSMLPSMVRGFEGEFWLLNNGPEYELHVSISVGEMDIEMRDSLIRVSSNNKNAAVVGITGKIRAVFDYMVLGGDEHAKISQAGYYGFASNKDFSYLWSLSQYRDGVASEETEKWDELEKSIIAKVADDVIVGVKGKSVSIIIKKSFEEK